MLRISVVESRNERRLVVEGKLIEPWANELRTAWEKARADLNGRALVIDVNNVTAISQDGKNVLLSLIGDGVKFRCRGVFTKRVLRQLACGIRSAGHDSKG
jgi:anti-anti-sigma regulatory factor